MREATRALSAVQDIQNLSGQGAWPSAERLDFSTSLSASSLNDHAGAKTQLSSIVSGATVLLTLLFLAPLLSNLPKAVLGALIIEALVMGMMNEAEMRRLARVQRFDFWIALAALAATLLVGVLAGVIIGIAFSLIRARFLERLG